MGEEASHESLKAQFAERLESVRLRSGGLSPHAFAKLCGIQDGSMRNFLAGNTLPSFESLVAIADATGVSLDYLMRGRAVTAYDRQRLYAVAAFVVDEWIRPALPNLSPEWAHALAETVVSMYEKSTRPESPVPLSDIRELARQFAAMWGLRDHLEELAKPPSS